MQSTHQGKRRPQQCRPRCCRCVVFPGMVDSTDQQRIVHEVLRLHHQSTARSSNNNSATDVPCPVHDDDNVDDNGSLDDNMLLEPSFWEDIKTLQTSRKLELGLSCCGGDVTKLLPMATTIARRAFARAALEAEKYGGEFLYYNGISNDKTTTTSLDYSSLKLLQTMGQQEQDETKCATPLTGLSLLYGPLASMPAHYDSPTQPGQREEWLAMISIGSSIIFRCNDELIKLDSGDVVVMDSMATLHGVESVVSTTEEDTQGKKNVDNSTYAELGLQTPSRLGLLFWQGRPTDEGAMTLPSQDDEGTHGASLLDGVGDLFADENE